MVLKTLSSLRARWRVAAVIGTFAAAACVGAGVAIASGQGTDSRSLAAISGPPALPNVYAAGNSAVSLSAADVAGTYPVFAQQAMATAPSATSTFGSFAMSRGADVAETRRLSTDGHGQTLYAAPASGAVCLGSSNSVINGCSPFPLAAPNEIVGSSALCTRSSDLEFAALLPGDPTNVVGHFSDGSSHAVSVTNGAVSIYSGPGEPVPMSITWDNGSHSLKADTGVPPGTVPSRCGR